MATIMALNSSLAARAAFGSKPAEKQARTSQIAKAGYSPSSSKTPDSALECELQPLIQFFCL